MPSTEGHDRDDSAVSDEDARTARSDGVERTVLIIFRLLRKFLSVALKAVWVGVRVGWCVLTDERRRVRARRWLLLTGNRWAIVGQLLALIFGGTLLLGLVPSIDLTEGGFVTTVFGAVTGGLFSFVPIVITVNQLTISQLVTTPDNLREKIGGVREFRAGIAEQTPERSVMSDDPSRFLEDVARLASQRASRFRQSDMNPERNPSAEALAEFEGTVRRLTVDLEERAAEDDLRLFDVVLLTMGDQYSKHVTTARRLLADRADALSPQTTDALADLRELLVSLDVFRQYLKALYVRTELARLSQLIAYTGIGAFLGSIFVLILYTSGTPAAGQSALLELVVCGALTLAALPFAVLFAFVVRLATIARRTVAPGAFTVDHPPLVDGPEER